MTIHTILVWSIIEVKPSPKLGISTTEAAADDTAAAAAAASFSAVLYELGKANCSLF